MKKPLDPHRMAQKTSLALSRRSARMDLKSWRADRLPAETEWLLGVMKEWEIACTIDAEWLCKRFNHDKNDFETAQMPRHQLRSVLRRHYLENGPSTLQGKALETMIEKFLRGIERATKNAHAAGLPQVQEIEFHAK